MNRKVTLIAATLVVILAALSFMTFNYFNRVTGTLPPVSSGQNTQPQANPPPVDETPQYYPVKVYFSKSPDSDDDPSKVFAVSRTSPDSGVASFAVKELLKGPTEAEKANGYFTTVRLCSGESNCNGQDFTLNVSDGVATLRFCRTFDHLGVVADGQADNEIKATLKQFNSVEKIVILNNNDKCEFDLSGLELCRQ